MEIHEAKKAGRRSHARLSLRATLAGEGEERAIRNVALVVILLAQMTGFSTPVTSASNSSVGGHVEMARLPSTVRASPRPNPPGPRPPPPPRRPPPLASCIKHFATTICDTFASARRDFIFHSNSAENFWEGRQSHGDCVRARDYERERGRERERGNDSWSTVSPQKVSLIERFHGWLKQLRFCPGRRFTASWFFNQRRPTIVSFNDEKCVFKDREMSVGGIDLGFTGPGQWSKLLIYNKVILSRLDY